MKITVSTKTDIFLSILVERQIYSGGEGGRTGGKEREKVHSPKGHSGNRPALPQPPLWVQGAGSKVEQPGLEPAPERGISSTDGSLTLD